MRIYFQIGMIAFAVMACDGLPTAETKKDTGGSELPDDSKTTDSATGTFNISANGLAKSYPEGMQLDTYSASRDTEAEAAGTLSIETATLALADPPPPGPGPSPTGSPLPPPPGGAPLPGPTPSPMPSGTTSPGGSQQCYASAAAKAAAAPTKTSTQGTKPTAETTTASQQIRESRERLSGKTNCFGNDRVKTAFQMMLFYSMNGSLDGDGDCYQPDRKSVV